MLNECQPKDLKRGYQVQKFAKGRNPDKIHEQPVCGGPVRDEYGQQKEEHEESILMAQCGDWRNIANTLGNTRKKQVQRD